MADHQAMTRPTLMAPPPGARSEQLVADAGGHTFALRPKVCPTCGPSAQRVLGSRGGAAHRYRLGVRTRIVQCCRCRLIFPNPFPYPTHPQQLYGDPHKYFAQQDETHRIREGRRLIRQIVARTGTAHPSMLDVGCGRGALLHAARLEGLPDVVGLEFSQAMVTYVGDTYGIAVVPQTIEEYAGSHPRTFDAIVLNAVLEHVYEPDAMMAACAQLTRPGSVVYIDTPNEPNLLTIVGNALNGLRGAPGVFNLSPTWMPYHVFGFNPCALQVLLNKHGFAMESLRVHAVPAVPSRPGLQDRVRAYAATQINRLANMTGTAGNMYVWARRIERPISRGAGDPSDDVG